MYENIKKSSSREDHGQSYRGGYHNSHGETTYGHRRDTGFRQSNLLRRYNRDLRHPRRRRRNPLHSPNKACPTHPRTHLHRSKQSLLPRSDLNTTIATLLQRQLRRNNVIKRIIRNGFLRQGETTYVLV